MERRGHFPSPEQQPAQRQTIKAPRISSLAEIQVIEAAFSRTINPEATSDALFSRLQEEVLELQEALVGGDKAEIGSELADVAIFCIGLANFFSIDVEDIVAAKLNRNYHKYNPVRFQEFIASGMSPHEA